MRASAHAREGRKGNSRDDGENGQFGSQEASETMDESFNLLNDGRRG